MAQHSLEVTPMDAATEKRQRSLLPGPLSQLNIGLKLGLCLLMLLLLNSCAATVSSTPAVPEAGAFSLFLQPLPQEAHRLRFAISELAVQRADGREILLTLRQRDFRGNGRIGVQKKLVSVTLPPGRYLGLRLLIETATLIGEEGEVALLPPTAPILAEYPFTIREEQAEALFLSLSADRLVTDGAFFTPKFSLWKAERILDNLIGFVSNSGSKSLTVFNKRNAQVIGAVQVGAEPRGLTLDQRRGWLYAALAGEDTISVVEINTSEILGQVRLRAGDEPIELALTESGNRLLALNRGSRTVSIIDTASLFELGRISLRSEANDILTGPDENRAYVIHAGSSSVSMLDLNSQRIARSASLDNSPHRGAISANGKTLYLANKFSSELLVVSAASLAVQREIFIGNGARSIKFDRASGLLYVGKQDGEIAVIDPSALMAIDSFSLPGPVQFLTIDNEENALFAVLPESRRVLKLDLISKRQIGSLELEADSYEVVVMGER